MFLDSSFTMKDGSGKGGVRGAGGQEVHDGFATLTR
jgi:hypothetical protein